MITFKLLQPFEIEVITNMMQEFYAIDNYPIVIEDSKKLFHEFISNENLGRAYLIYLDENVVGYAILTFIFSFENKGKIAFIDELYIKNTFRSKGIGSKAIQFLKNECKKFELKLIYLEVENHNLNAQKAYLTNDFEFHNRKIMKYKTQ